MNLYIYIYIYIYINIYIYIYMIYIYIFIYYMARSSERALCSEFCVLIGYPSGGKMEQYCPPGTAHFVPANKILPKFKPVHKSFLLLKLFSANTKRFFVLSLSLRNQKMGKPKASRRMKTKKTKKCCRRK